MQFSFHLLWCVYSVSWLSPFKSDHLGIFAIFVYSKTYTGTNCIDDADGLLYLSDQISVHRMSVLCYTGQFTMSYGLVDL